MTSDFFEWDDDKALANVRSHGVTFEEASTIFEDAYSITERDVANSDFEDRFVTIGLSLVSRIVFVVHTEREERIRIISARRATPSEWAVYEDQH